jgi:hypothetical protein
MEEQKAKDNYISRSFTVCSPYIIQTIKSRRVRLVEQDSWGVQKCMFSFSRNSVMQGNCLRGVGIGGSIILKCLK